VFSDRISEVGVRVVALFFSLAFLISTLTIFALSYPRTWLGALWRLNPPARTAFEGMGGSAFLLLAVVGTSCLLASIGLFTKVEWGRRIAVAVLVVNLIGDVTAAVLRSDPRTLIGLPVGGAMVWFLSSGAVRNLFAHNRTPAGAGQGETFRR
jgi:hypothetical protein